jgi:ABC-2 type transport system ATP-binding protein
MIAPFLELRGVSKRYAGKTAVDRVSFDIPKQSIFGLLGPNGAGKTSIIRMLTCITHPDDGTISFSGEPLQPAHAARIGYMPEERGLYKKMKVREHIIYLLRLKDRSLAEARSLTDAWMQRLEMTDWANKKISDLSKGMQQKVQFVATVAHGPDLLILDEPFSGLDPINAQVIEDEIRRLRQEGATIIFSTHRMEQVEEICDHIVLIDRGKVLLQDTVRSVRSRFTRGQYLLEFTGSSQALTQLSHARVLSHTDHSAEVALNPGSTAAKLLAELAASPLEVLRFEQHVPRLQEIFIETVKAAGHE